MPDRPPTDAAGRTAVRNPGVVARSLEAARCSTRVMTAAIRTA